ncbi:MAG: hypothetical protein NZ552_04710, partial [Planctomycetes bacterium]|nr:hypothetical protein [Planctomycetota bacterium]
MIFGMLIRSSENSLAARIHGLMAHAVFLFFQQRQTMTPCECLPQALPSLQQPSVIEIAQAAVVAAGAKQWRAMTGTARRLSFEDDDRPLAAGSETPRVGGAE